MQATSTRDLVHPLTHRPLKPDEWSEDYLVSVVRDHGLRRPQPLDRIRIRGCLPWHQSGLDETEAARHSRGLELLQGRARYGPIPLPFWASLTDGHICRYCPHCFSQDRYLRARWRIPDLLVCTKHGCFLKADMCEPAIRPAKASEKVVYRATVTDEELYRDAVCCLPSEFKVLSAIWGPMERAAEESALAAMDGQVAMVVAWALVTWRVVLRVAVAHVGDVVGSAAIGPAASIARLFADLGLSVSPDEGGVKRFLLGLRDNVHFMAAKREFRRLMRDEERQPTLAGKLPLAELEALCGSAAPNAVGVTRAWEIAFREERRQCFTRNEVMEQFGVSEVIVNRWIREGMLRRTEMRKVGQKWMYFIDRRDVKELWRRAQGLTYMDDFIDRNHMDSATYCALREGGFLKPVVFLDRRHIVQDEFTALLCRLELMCAPRPATVPMEHLLFGPETRRLAQSRDVYCSLVQAALDGRFTLYRDPQKSGLAAFSFGAEGLVALSLARITVRGMRALTRYPAQLSLLEEAA